MGVILFDTGHDEAVLASVYRSYSRVGVRFYIRDACHDKKTLWVSTHACVHMECLNFMSNSFLKF